MTTLALYAASAALFAASPSADTAAGGAQAAPLPAEDSAALREGEEARAASAQLPEAVDPHGRRAVMPADEAPARGADPGFIEASDASLFQQQTWTGP